MRETLEQEVEKGLRFEPYFTQGKDPYEIQYKTVKVEIKKSDGTYAFQQEGVEVPVFWSDNATQVVASKYFKQLPNGKREHSARELVSRVADTMTEQGVKQGILSGETKEAFRRDIAYLMLNQYASFNSPVWFNLGLSEKYGVGEDKEPEARSYWAHNSETEKVELVPDSYKRPQVSACFITSIKDDMRSILEHTVREGMIFKHGSGNGTNYSNLRGMGEPLSKGGTASGLISFLGIFDEEAGGIRSGGTTRRAAKMVILNADHYDAFRFIKWKVSEEKKALQLSAREEWAPAYPGDLESDAYKTVNGQNGNNSIRVNDGFMKAVQNGDLWSLWRITSDRKSENENILSLDDYLDDRYLPDKEFIKRITDKRKIVSAKEMFEIISRAAYLTGDPGLQFDDVTNKWNTCKKSGRINASNPCSEFVFLDDSACNLASLNLSKFIKDGKFDVESFQNAVRLIITAQEILVDFGSYPTQDIAQNSHDFRPLGLGYADLASVLMISGIPYDSDKGRNMAAAITSLMTGTAYEHSARIAEIVGAFPRYEENRKSFREVMIMHKDACQGISKEGIEDLVDTAQDVWGKVVAADKFRNAQTTLLAPTGTIGFMMDVRANGIEPIVGNVVKKSLVEGGQMYIVNETVNESLKRLDYSDAERESIMRRMRETGSFKRTSLKEEHYPIFATAMGDNTIHINGHIDIVGAVQPHLSGAVSKTMNLPRTATVDDVKQAYFRAFEKGLKAVSLFVDGCKGAQPLEVLVAKEDEKTPKWGEKKKPPMRREGFNLSVEINGTPVYLSVTEYEDVDPYEAPAEFFISFGQSGSPHAAMYTEKGKDLSRRRQLGESISKLIESGVGTTGDIGGFTSHPYIKQCSSLQDFLLKWVALEYLGDDSYCQIKPDKEERLDLRHEQLRVERRNREIWKREHWIDRVMKGEAGYKKDEDPKNKIVEEKVSNNMAIKNLTRRICVLCGAEMIISGANCYKCPNCKTAEGCG